MKRHLLRRALAAVGRRDAFVLALLGALLILVTSYAVLRIVQVWLYSEPDPAIVIWATPVGLFWRLAISAYASAMMAPLLYLAAQRNQARTARVIVSVLPAVAVLLGLQGVLVP